MIRTVYSMDAGSDILKICDKSGEILVNTANVLLKTAYNEITAYGDTAKQLLGKLPPDFRLIKPIREGNICDFDAMVQLLHLLFLNDKSKIGLFKPDFIVNTSINATVVEQEALCEAVIEAGVSKCYLVDSPVAATIGAGVDVAESKGNMIVIVGSEHTEVAILSLSNLVFSATPDFSLRSLMRLTTQYMSDVHEIMLGENTVESMVKETLSQENAKEHKLGPIVGIDKKNGLPKKIQIAVKEIWDLILQQLQFLGDSLRESMEGIPPELIKDIMERGILFTGGLANYQGLVNYMKQVIEINLIVPQEPEYLCVRGNMVIHRNKALHPLIQEVF